jgi:nicotinamidase-related amidase
MKTIAQKTENKLRFIGIFLVLLFLALLFLTRKIPLTTQKTAGETNFIACRTFNPNLVRFDKPSSLSGYQESTVKIDPKKTALMVIDLWDGVNFLEDIIKYKINPLLALARKNKITVIHAVSDSPPNYKAHHDLSIEPEDIFIYGYDLADGYLYRQGIDTLLYVGFDALLCVLDKPNGIFNILSRNPNFKTILIRDAVISENEEMKITAINLVESQLGCSLTTEDLFNYFQVTPPEEIFHPIKTSFTTSFNLAESDEPLLASETALVVVGLNNDIRNSYWQGEIENLIQTKIVPILKVAREKNLTIIYAPGYDKEMSTEIKPLENESVVTSEKKFMQIIIENHLKNLLYVGYGLNGEILFGPAGITRMYMQSRYKKNPTVAYYLIKDAVLTFETPETKDNEIIKNTLLKYYREMNLISSEKLPSLIH